uniref:Uncharacterized protein n=1 Tax=Timema genevievae TaxID=629358 RepID=A0A7R9PLB4_TIMGE|nr:unnamed protein product [Timema genevievae]
MCPSMCFYYRGVCEIHFHNSKESNKCNILEAE